MLSLWPSVSLASGCLRGGSGSCCPPSAPSHPRRCRVSSAPVAAAVEPTQSSALAAAQALLPPVQPVASGG
eukprot:scaffold18772_cov112-Isochrysis_galbana.AAC.4